MTEARITQIWKPDTGILDLESDSAALSASEIPGIKAVWTEQRARLKNTQQLADFSERLSREWAIETGVIENLYDIERGVTQTLIERGFQAELLSHGSTNRPRDYVLRLIRDQKDVLDGVFDFVKNDRVFSVSYIKELHAALLRSQDVTEGIDALGHLVDIPLIKGDWKRHPNSPVRDGVTFGYCPPEHVAAEMDRLVEIHTRHVAAGVSSDVQAAWLHHRFTQIHPFQDGNGRVARAITSLVLIKNGLFPLVVTRDDRAAYLEALEAADQGTLKPLIDLIAKLQITQFRKATSISEAILAADLSDILDELMTAADGYAATKLGSFRAVFDLAKQLQHDLNEKFESILQNITAALRKVTPIGKAYVKLSTKETEYWFRSQIIENARLHLKYFADMTEYSSWILIDMKWSRHARLVFAFHGIGKPFNGSLICAPFLEFRDTDDEGQIRSELVPVTEEGFVFFYNEAREKLLARFGPWRDNVLKVAIKELAQNL